MKEGTYSMVVSSWEEGVYKPALVASSLKVVNAVCWVSVRGMCSGAELVGTLVVDMMRGGRRKR